MAHFPGFVFYIPCSHCRVRSNCPSSAKLCRRPLANLPPVSTLYLPHRSLYHMMPKLFTYLFVSWIKARSRVLFIVLPQCVEINKLSTNTLEGRWMNELILGGQMDWAGQRTPLGLLSFSREVSLQVLVQTGGNPPSHRVTSGFKRYCPCLPSFERHLGEQTCPSEASRTL